MDEKVDKMPHSDHIAEFDQRGWMLIHPLRCPGMLLDCEVTQLCQQLQYAPAIGRFWAYADAKNNSFTLRLGEPVPREIEGTSRRTGYSYHSGNKRPGAKLHVESNANSAVDNLGL